MSYGLYLSAAGAFGQSQKIDVLSNNMANIDTVGFKKELALLEARDAEAIERGITARGTKGIDDIGGGVRMNATSTDFRLGTVRPTGIPTDFAMEREDTFFAVQRDKETLLTRAGNFQIGSDGRLLTREGDSVLSTDGSAIVLDSQLPWQMLPGGIITQGGDAREIAVRVPENVKDLQKVGQNYFSASKTLVNPATPEQRKVRSGYVEQSTVNPMQEMVELITASRGYETNIKMIQNHDSMMGSLVSRLLRPPS